MGHHVERNELRYISLFSGIEAFSVAVHPLGNWKPVAFADFDDFPSAVLEQRFPDVPNLKDITKVNWNDYKGKADLVVGGSPCQSFSIAGKRLGMDDPRGNLAIEYLRVIKAVQPRWFIFENVGGLLSSDEGRDFGHFLTMVGELGYGFAYRVLDAKWFGVPQRRRRVFVVGCADGDWRSASAVLFDEECLSGHSRSRISKGEEHSTDSGRGTFGSGWTEGGLVESNNDGEEGHSERGRGIDSFTLNLSEKRNDDTTPTVCAVVGSGADVDVGIVQHLDEPHAVSQDINAAFTSKQTGTITTREGCTSDTAHLVAQAFKNDDFSLSDTDTPTLTSNEAKRGDMTTSIIQADREAPAICLQDADQPEGKQGGSGIGDVEPDVSYTLLARGVHGVGQPVRLGFAQTQHGNVRFEGGDGEIAGSILTDGGHAKNGTNILDIEPSDDLVWAEHYDAKGKTVRLIEGHGEVSSTLTTNEEFGQFPKVVNTSKMVVRRLTPIECERLQGFPDDWTKISWRGKPADECPDGHRYKACGNSMAVPVMRWIADGIQLVDAIERTEITTTENRLLDSAQDGVIVSKSTMEEWFA